MPITIRRLEPGDNRKGFRSGNIDLDRFFERYAGQNQFRHHIGTTYVAIDKNKAIVGFATVAASELIAELLPKPKGKNLPAYPLPILRLARLTVDERAQGRGVGNALLRSVLILARNMANDVGCVGVVVDAKPEAIAFYKKAGFTAPAVKAGQLGDRPEPAPMFLELGAIPKQASRKGNPGDRLVEVR